MVEKIAVDPIPYNYLDGEAIHLASGVNAEFSARVCAPMAFASIAAGGDIGVEAAYRFWYGRFACEIASRGLLGIERDGVPYGVIMSVLKELSGGSLDSADYPIERSTGWRAFQLKRRYRESGAVRVERVSVAEVGRKFGTAVVSMIRPNHVLGIKNGELYDSFNSQFRGDGRTLRRAFHIFQPSSKALEKVRRLIRFEE